MKIGIGHVTFSLIKTLRGSEKLSKTEGLNY